MKLFLVKQDVTRLKGEYLYRAIVASKGGKKEVVKLILDDLRATDITFDEDRCVFKKIAESAAITEECVVCVQTGQDWD